MTLRTLGLLALFPALLAGCARDKEEDAERRELRTAAARNACVAEELLIRARENLATMAPSGQGGAAGSALRAAYEYAQVYGSHAQLRMGMMANMDSALSARTAADSARYMKRAEGFDLRPPEPGTLDANVANAYARDFAQARANPGHYCNQEPLAGGKDER
ncbi:MAG TPA: hypothetical protein VF263_06210 [Longimicrobiaceae bacterium]